MPCSPACKPVSARPAGQYKNFAARSVVSPGLTRFGWEGGGAATAAKTGGSCRSDLSPTRCQMQRLRRTEVQATILRCTPPIFIVCYYAAACPLTWPCLFVWRRATPVLAFSQISTFPYSFIRCRPRHAIFTPALYVSAVFIQVFYTRISKVPACYPCLIGGRDGRVISRPGWSVLWLGLPVGGRLPFFGRKAMSWLYAVSGGLSLLLYLIYALLRPEEF